MQLHAQWDEILFERAFLMFHLILFAKIQSEIGITVKLRALDWSTIQF